MRDKVRCDYADLPHSGGGTNHGHATQSKGGYRICQKCYDAIVAAEKAEESAYAALRHDIADECEKRITHYCENPVNRFDRFDLLNLQADLARYAAHMRRQAERIAELEDDRKKLRLMHAELDRLCLVDTSCSIESQASCEQEAMEMAERWSLRSRLLKAVYGTVKSAEM